MRLLCVFSAQMQASGKKKKELRYRSVISDIFDGSILSLVQCLTCDRVSLLAAINQIMKQQGLFSSNAVLGETEMFFPNALKLL